MAKNLGLEEHLNTLPLKARARGYKPAVFHVPKPACWKLRGLLCNIVVETKQTSSSGLISRVRVCKESVILEIKKLCRSWCCASRL
jgi:hypothetical protein